MCPGASQAGLKPGAAGPERCLPVCPDRAPAEGVSRACVRQGCEELHQSVADTFFLSQNRRKGVCGPTRAAGRVEWNCVRARHTCTPPSTARLLLSSSRAINKHHIQKLVVYAYFSGFFSNLLYRQFLCPSCSVLP